MHLTHERYALSIAAGSDPAQIAQGIVQRWCIHDPLQRRGFQQPRIIAPPAGLRLALTAFCTNGGVLLVDTMAARPVITAWTPASGVPLPAPVPRLSSCP